MGKEAKAMESVIITLKSTQQGRENEAEETELDTLGTCQRKDGVLELSYEDSEVTGFVGSTTMVRVEQSDTGMLVNVMRSGTANSNLILERNISACTTLRTVIWLSALKQTNLCLRRRRRAERFSWHIPLI